MQDHFLSIRTTDAIFRNAILKCSKRENLNVHMQKVEIIKFVMALVCVLEKVGTVCKLYFMLMHVFGRIRVEWRNLTMDILAIRAVLAPNFVERGSLVLVSMKIMCGIILM